MRIVTEEEVMRALLAGEIVEGEAEVKPGWSGVGAPRQRGTGPDGLCYLRVVGNVPLPGDAALRAEGLYREASRGWRGPRKGRRCAHRQPTLRGPGRKIAAKLAPPLWHPRR